MKIWNLNKSCHKLPSFLVVGPQKTGTTALYTFLKMHPDILSSEQSINTFEEVQFFNGHNYNRGVDWWVKISIHSPVPHRSGMRALLRISKPSVSRIEEEALSLSVFSTTVSYWFCAYLCRHHSFSPSVFCLSPLFLSVLCCLKIRPCRLSEFMLTGPHVWIISTCKCTLS